MLLLDCGCIISFQSLEIGQVICILSDATDVVPKLATQGEVIERRRDPIGTPNAKN